MQQLPYPYALLIEHERLLDPADSNGRGKYSSIFRDHVLVQGVVELAECLIREKVKSL